MLDLLDIDIASARLSESEGVEVEPLLKVIALSGFASILLAAKSCTASASISNCLVPNALTDVFCPAVRVMVIVVPSTAFTVAPDKETSLVLPFALINNLLVSTLDAGVASIVSENVIVNTPVLELYVAEEKHGRLSIAFPDVGTVPEVVPGVQDSVISPLLVTVPFDPLVIPVLEPVLVFAILIVPPELLVSTPVVATAATLDIPIPLLFEIVITPPELLVVVPLLVPLAAPLF